MSILVVTKEELTALQAEFEKMIAADTLPGGVRLGEPVDMEDGTFIFVDSRWDGEDGIASKIEAMQKDEKVDVGEFTMVCDSLDEYVVRKTVIEERIETEKIAADLAVAEAELEKGE